MNQLSHIIVDDAWHIDRVKNEGCSDSFLALKAQYGSVINGVAGRYTGMARSAESGAACFRDSHVEILESAISSFNPSKNTKFSSWLYSQARYFFLGKLNKDKRISFVPTESLIEISDNQTYHLDSPKQPLTEYVFDLASQSRDTRVLKILKMRYSSPKSTYEEIGNKMDISTQQAKNIHDGFIDFCKKKLASGDNIDII